MALRHKSKQRNVSNLHHLVILLTTTAVLRVKSVTSASLPEYAVKKYLVDFGYLDQEDDATISRDQIKNALHDFQKFAGLPDTGEEDTPTMEKMMKPRCGVSDRGRESGSRPEGVEGVNGDHRHHSSEGRSRKKRWRIYSGWPKNNLTYRISTYTETLPKAKVDDAIRRAFQLWSDVALINFTQVESTGVKPDIDISFYRGDHGDGRAFDGQGYVLAHTYPPGYTSTITATNPDLVGDIHFDEDENWTVESADGKNLWLTAAHEIGHAIGLSHSTILNAIMYPWYPNFDPNFRLHRDDIMGIQFLYGARPGAEVTYPTVLPVGPNNPSVPNLCTTAPAAMLHRLDGAMYAVKGSYYWLLSNGQIVPGYPKLISVNWVGLQSNVTAALTVRNARVWGSDVGKTFFFKNRAVWLYSDYFGLEPGYPKDIQTVFPTLHPGIRSVDAVTEISANGETLFIMDGYLYLYSWEKVFRGPFVIDQLIPGLQGTVHSLIQGPDNFLYFFTDNGLYYQVSPWTFRVSALFPKPFSQDWFSCNQLRSSEREGDDHDGEPDGNDKRDAAKRSVASSLFNINKLCMIFGLPFISLLNTATL